jgi:hypothetical protein
VGLALRVGTDAAAVPGDPRPPTGVVGR